MWTNVYLLVHSYENSNKSGIEIMMPHPTEEDAVAYFRKMTGQPGTITDRTTDSRGHKVAVLDGENSASYGLISQYRMRVIEEISDPTT